jgi:hypothetical protein
MLLERDGKLRTARLRTDTDGAMYAFSWGETFTALELMLKYHVELASADERTWLLKGVSEMKVKPIAGLPTRRERASRAIEAQREVTLLRPLAP